MASTSVAWSERVRLAARAKPAQAALALLSAWWVANGVVALLYTQNFATDPVQGITVHLLGIPIMANGWHGVFHLLTGALGLLAARGRRPTAGYGIACGLFYIATGVYGYVTGTQAWGLMCVNDFGSAVHILEGLLGIGIGFAAVRSLPRRSADPLLPAPGG